MILLVSTITLLVSIKTLLVGGFWRANRSIVKNGALVQGVGGVRSYSPLHEAVRNTPLLVSTMTPLLSTTILLVGTITLLVSTITL